MPASVADGHVDVARALADAIAAALGARTKALQRGTLLDVDRLDLQLVDVGAVVVLGIGDRRLERLLDDAGGLARREGEDVQRLVADQIRGLPVEKALNLLAFSPKKGARIIKKVLESAIANAEHNDGADIDELKVKTIYVDKAESLRRFTARAKGRGNVILKQTCHIHVVVGDGK